MQRRWFGASVFAFCAFMFALVFGAGLQGTEALVSGSNLPLLFIIAGAVGAASFVFFGGLVPAWARAKLERLRMRGGWLAYEVLCYFLLLSTKTISSVFAKRRDVQRGKPSCNRWCGSLV